MDIHSFLDTAEDYYSFMKFDRTISKIASVFTPKTVANSSKLGMINDELDQIQDNMKQNLKAVYLRGNELNEMKDTASEVLNMSSSLKLKATQTKRDLMMRKYLLFGVVGAIVLLIILAKLFL